MRTLSTAPLATSMLWLWPLAVLAKALGELCKTCEGVAESADACSRCRQQAAQALRDVPPLLGLDVQTRYICIAAAWWPSS